jgi:serine/threonine protein kinase
MCLTRVVFLGEDNSVKLGDFGLSKIMRSHDFASTYVGTPFYMSPEICAAERYTLRSDIWSLGCIIYELCARDPPFNATTHFNLVNKIKVGKYPDLPAGYSPELQEVIRKCLRVNPNTRPDTASLLDLPIVRLVRKEKEVVALGKVLATKESKLDLQIKQAEEQLNSFEAEKQNKTQEVESSVRREWEVKARLEIDKHIQREKMRLTKEFETEVRSKVELELSKPTSSKEYDIPQSSVSTNDDAEFPSTTDLTSLSLESPTLQKSAPLRKSTRTPFGRAQTMFVGSPMDIQMAEPSPMSIASLSLSPRRNGAGPGTDGSKNIFTIATDKIDNDRWQGTLAYSTDEGEDEDDLPLPSPTRQKPASKNPFNKPIRPTLVSQKTAPQKPNNQPSIFSKPQAPTTSGHSDTQKPAPEKKTASPSRRLSKIPSSTSLVPVSPDRGSPVRRSKSSRALLTNTTNLPPSAAATTISDDLAKQVTKGNMMKGRTLLELAQARAGGRPVSSHGLDSDSGITKRKGLDFKGRMDALTNKLEAPTWDPERDEMPSPFLDRRGGRGIRGGF